MAAIEAPVLVGKSTSQALHFLLEQAVGRRFTPRIDSSRVSHSLRGTARGSASSFPGSDAAGRNVLLHRHLVTARSRPGRVSHEALAFRA